MLENINKYHVMLASKSPRRRELLSELRIPFSAISIGGIDESYPEDMPKSEVPQFLANKKANAYMKQLRSNEMIITADTLVILNDKIYGKPANIEDARKMLKELSGKTHEVISGVCILTNDRRTSFTSKTKVKFTNLTDKEIDYYVNNYMPLDKAGAYGIQEWIGTIAVESIEGSFYNVMGLPVHQLYKELQLF